MALPILNTMPVEQSEVVFSPELLKITIRIPSEAEYLNNAILTLRGVGEHLGISDARVNRMALALEEVLLNTIEHAYVNGEGLIDIEFQVDDELFSLIIQDYGKGLPPDAENPLLTEEQILSDRGRGLSLVRHLPDKVTMGPNDQETGTKTVMLFYLLNCA